MPKVHSFPIKVLRKKIFRFKYFVCLAFLGFSVVKIYRIVQPPPYPFEAGQTNVNSLLTDEEYRKIFQPLLSTVKCDEVSITLVAINSAATNLQQRQAIRETWFKWVKASNQSILFFIARPEDPFLLKELELENYYFNDIVLLSVRVSFKLALTEFIKQIFPCEPSILKETYYLLTFKTLSILHWSLSNCPNIRFLIKCDDDMFLNWPKLNAFLTENQNQTNTIIGKPNRDTKPNRDRFSRWFMPKELYELDYYPDFADGPIYILTADLLPRLLNATNEVKPIYLEDVYVTGRISSLF